MVSCYLIMEDLDNIVTDAMKSHSRGFTSDRRHLRRGKHQPLGQAGTRHICEKTFPVGFHMKYMFDNASKRMQRRADNSVVCDLMMHNTLTIKLLKICYHVIMGSQLIPSSWFHPVEYCDSNVFLRPWIICLYDMILKCLSSPENPSLVALHAFKSLSNYQLQARYMYISLMRIPHGSVASSSRLLGPKPSHRGASHQPTSQRQRSGLLRTSSEVVVVRYRTSST